MIPWLVAQIYSSVEKLASADKGTMLQFQLEARAIVCCDFKLAAFVHIKPFVFALLVM